MIHKIKLGFRPLAAALFIGFMGFISMNSSAHPAPSNEERVEERKRLMTEKREQMRKKAAERRMLHKEKSERRRAESKRKQDKYIAFKTELLSMLVDDAVILSDQDTLSVKYSAGHPVVNGIDLTERFGDKYEALWASYDRTISEKSYMNIGPNHFEIREITKDGRSHHFSIQTG